MSRHLQTTSFAMDVGRGAFASAVVDSSSRAFVFGGLGPRNRPLASIESFHTRRGWIPVSLRLPAAVTANAAVSTDTGRVYVSGGFDGNARLHQCASFDPRERTLGVEEAMLAPRAGHTLLQVKNSLYALGGAGL